MWAKTMMHLIIGYIHAGDRERAKNIQEELYHFYSTRCDICEEYKVKLNILRRKATAFFDVDIARSHLKKSTDFFSNGIESSIVKYPREYYMSLVNYSANLLCSGKFSDAYECIVRAIKLCKDYDEIRFPRPYIGINNYLIALFFIREKSPEDIETVFETMLKNKQNIADEYLLISNWAIFCALSGKLEKASKLLEDIMAKAANSQTKEPSYIYHATTNLAVIHIIQRQYERADDLLKSLDSTVGDVYYHFYYQKKHTLLKNAVRDKLTYNQNNITHMLTDLCPHYQSRAWNFFGFVYSLDPLEHWDES
jgi:tetratricopeptide (TPR) repeat protein